LKTDRVRQRIERGLNQHQPQRLAEVSTLVRVGENSAPVCMDYRGAESSAIEIPDGIDLLVETDLKLARRWRESTRVAFTSAIDAGLVVEEFFRLERQGRRVGIYLLNREAC